MTFRRKFTSPFRRRQRTAPPPSSTENDLADEFRHPPSRLGAGREILDRAALGRSGESDGEPGQTRFVLTGGTSRMEQDHIARIKSHLQRPVVDLSGQMDLLTLAALIERARLLVTIDSAPMHLAAALGTPQVALFGPTQSLSLASALDARDRFAGRNREPMTDFVPETDARRDEGNLDGTGDRCYADAAVESGSASRMSENQTPSKPKQSLWTTIRIGVGSLPAALWLRHALQGPVHPWPGLRLPRRQCISSHAAGPRQSGRLLSSMAPRPQPATLAAHPELLEKGPPINSLVLILPRHPGGHDRAQCLCGYCNAYYMTWVSAKVLTDIRTQLFGKMLSHSMDFFNKMQSGFLMSRITNDTRMMQTALSSISSDLFKQPIAIISGVGVLLYMDWKFTLVTLVLFPSCLVPLSMYGKRARKAVKGEQEDMGQMVVTMQETFARHPGHQIICAAKSTRKNRFGAAIGFSSTTRCASPVRRKRFGPLVESIAAIGVGLALFYVYFAQPPGREIHGSDRRNLPSLRSDQNPQPHAHHACSAPFRRRWKFSASWIPPPASRINPARLALPHSHGLLEFERVTFRYDGGMADALNETSASRSIPAKVTPSSARAARAKAPFFRSFCAFTIRPAASSGSMATICAAHPNISAAADRPRLAGDFSLSRYDSQKHPVRPARRDQEEIYAAAQTAYAHDFIMAQPHGYETIIGDKGCLLSGGQQRVCDRPRPAEKRADPAPRRSDFRARFRIGTANPARARTPRQGPYGYRDRAPTLDHSFRRPDRRDGERPDQRNRHARGLLENSGYYRRLYDLQFNRNPDEPGAEVELLAEATV